MPITRTRTLFLSPDDDCHAALLAAARSATKSLHVLIYGFTLPDLVDVLIQKQHAGLSVGVVVDHTQASGATQEPLMQRLVDAGVPVTITTSHGAIMHEKCLLVDLELGADHNASLAVYGSWNFSRGANKQANHLQSDNDPSICAAFWQQYQQMQQYGVAHCPQLSPRGASAPAARLS
jgi:phosphatidylserine/phosphatidylglycerophosphate/cardiolipin synthase-like enzyme